MYILLCGYPPFYSENGANLSDRMKRKIKAGDYGFPQAEWKDISGDAISAIQRMLTVDPAKRITINEVLNCAWLTELKSERPIDMSSIRDEITLTEIQVSSKSYLCVVYILI